MHEMDVHTLPPFERCQVDGFFAFWSAGLVGGKKSICWFSWVRNIVFGSYLYISFIWYTKILPVVSYKLKSNKHHPNITMKKNEPWLAASVIFPILIPTSEFVKTSRAKSCLGRSKERRNWLNSTGVLTRPKTGDVVFFKPQHKSTW